MEPLALTMPKPAIPGKISSLSTSPTRPASVTPALCWAWWTIFEISPNTQTKTGTHSLGFYAQDSWKVTKRFTLDYGLRYDFQTYLKEQYGRMPIASFSTIDPTVGLPGAEIYGATCNCQLSHNYPWAFGPRVGAAYQINSKTVLRAGAGITYGVVQTPQGVQYSLANYYTFNSTGYGISPSPNGFPAANPYPNVTWPNYDPGRLPILTQGLLPPSSPNTIFSPSARPPRTLQWSIGLQREIQKDIVVEATYVGNRGVWWSAEGLDQYQCNCLTPQILATVRAQPQQSGGSRIADGSDRFSAGHCRWI